MGRHQTVNLAPSGRQSSIPWVGNMKSKYETTNVIDVSSCAVLTPGVPHKIVSKHYYKPNLQKSYFDLTWNLFGNSWVSLVAANGNELYVLGCIEDNIAYLEHGVDLQKWIEDNGKPMYKSESIIGRTPYKNEEPFFHFAE